MSDIEIDDDVECKVTFTCIGTALSDRWEAACPCGFWTTGTKQECRRRASGHPPRRI